MTRTGHFRPKRSVLLLAVPRVQLIDIVGPLEAFDIANRVLEQAGTPAHYKLEVASIGPRVATASGLVIATTTLARATPAHTLIIGGHLAMADEATPKTTLAAIGRLARRAERVVSVCAGAFVLGELGLLDGRRCTTHWLVLDALRARFPKAVVEPDAIYADDHPIYSSAGATCGLDLALHLIERDLGARMALAVARLMVVFLHRPGGQSQFSASMQVGAHADRKLRELVAAIVTRPRSSHRVDEMARRVGMSTRNFARIFRAQTGSTPAAFVESARLDAARAALETTDQTMAWIADACGFGTEETLRRAFQRSLGVAPADYRRRFHRTGADVVTRSSEAPRRSRRARRRERPA